MTQKVVFWPRYRHELWDWAIQLADRAPLELHQHFALVVARELDAMGGDEPADVVGFLRSRLEAGRRSKFECGRRPSMRAPRCPRFET